MKRISSYSIVPLLFFLFASPTLSIAKQQTDQTAAITIGQLDPTPLAFTENAGQWDKQVKFRASAAGTTMWFTSNGIYFQLTRRISAANPSEQPTFSPAPYYASSDSIEQLIIKASFAGANPNPEIIGENMMEYKCNYLIGNDPTNWYTDVSNFTSVLFKDIYPGIDLRYIGTEDGKAQYEFIVAPGANIEQVKIKYEGIDNLSVDADGHLIAQTGWGDMIAPLGTSIDGNVSAERGQLLFSQNTSDFSMSSRNTPRSISFAVVLGYSTYLGGNALEESRGIAVDNSGAAYVTGSTWSSSFPTLGPYQTDQGNIDAFITKLSDSGNFIYSTYLGGSEEDFASGIAVDNSGTVYVAGWTYSTDFPTLNPYQSINQGGEYDAFVTKLSSAGDSLVYSTYLGGNRYDRCFSVVVDASGAAYVTGETSSYNFPTLNPYQTHQRDMDAFVTKFSGSGNDLVYSTYLGGNDYDRGYGIAIDNSEAAYITGYTSSTDFPTLNPYQTDQDREDAFVTKLSASGNSLIYSTYLGGNDESPGLGDDLGLSIAVDDSGAAYVTGMTSSTDFPTLNPYQTYQAYFDAFITKLSSSGSSLVYSTYLGGDNNDEGFGIAVDDFGAVYIIGRTVSSDFPVVNSYLTDHGFFDAFVTKLSSAGNNLVYSTYLGGTNYDGGDAIAIDDSGTAYVTGQTKSINFPIFNPYQPSPGGDYDAFVSKLQVLYYSYICGDADASGAVDIDDVVSLIQYIFAGNTPPDPLESGDADCSGDVDIDDVVYLINFIFDGGPQPCDTNGDQTPDCYESSTK